MRVFFSAGEASGDRYAAAIARELPPCEIEGIGGPCLHSVGANVVVDSSHWGAVSISQSLKVGAKVLLGERQARKHLLQGKPGLFIAIDFGYINIRLSRFAKEHGWKVLYFIPPGSWRRDRQGVDLPKVTDQIVTPFSWSAELLNKMGAQAHWFGHPLKQLVGDVPTDSQRSGIAFLPGSRRHEIDLHLPLVAEALKDESRRIEFALSPNADREMIEAKWRGLVPSRTQDVFTLGDTYGVLQRAEASVVCSGTATLEAAICRCPMVVIYKLSRMMAIEYAILRPKIKFASLPNILLDRLAVPELLHYYATPENVREKLSAILNDPTARQHQLIAFDELGTILGNSHAISETANIAAQMMA